MPQYYPQQQMQAPMPEAPKKIIVESYDQYIPKEYDNLQELNISDESDEDQWYFLLYTVKI